MADAWPDTLIKDLARRNVAIVLGAGVSKNSLGADGTTRPPVWSEFLNSALERVGNSGTNHIKRAIREGDYLHACEWLKERLDDDWIDFLRSRFLTPNYSASDLHDKIFRLDQRVTLSLNLDNIYETFVQRQTGGMVQVKRFFDSDVFKFLRDEAYFVIKVHGTIEAPNQIIFTQQEYSKARTQNALFYHALDACILSHTFLFIGCGVSDPDFNLILENQNFRFPDAQPHYIVTSSKTSQDLEQSLRKNRNLKCIKYDPSNNHAELLRIFENLNKRVEAFRIQQGGQQV
tara:strand:+ start:1165 stop:2031 length:867 start_codon:yes stop_codon:yes gene_type:complete